MTSTDETHTDELPAVYVEQISEDRASRTLLRIHLLDRIRRECLNHPHLEKRLKLCQPSSDMPAWWVPGNNREPLMHIYYTFSFIGLKRQRGNIQV